MPTHNGYLINNPITFRETYTTGTTDTTWTPYTTYYKTANEEITLNIDKIETIIDFKLKQSFEKLYKSLSEMFVMPISEEEFMNILLEGDKE